MNADAHLRIGDAERERAASELGEHYAQGRLTQEEHEERLGRIWSAKTYADVAPQFADLPGPHRPAAHPGAVAAAPRAVPAYARRRRRLPAPLAVVLAVLLAVAVLANLPVMLFVLLGWFVLTRGFHGCGSRRHGLRH